MFKWKVRRDNIHTLTFPQATRALQYPIYMHSTSFSSLNEVFLRNETDGTFLLWHSNNEVAEMWLSYVKFENIVGKNRTETKSIETHIHNI